MMAPTSPNSNTSNSIEDGQTSYTSQPTFRVTAATTTTTAQRRIRTNQNHHHNIRALSWSGKFILISFGLVTFLLCLGMLGTVLAPEFPTVTIISTTTSADHLEFSLTLANPNGKGLSYTNLSLTPNFLVKVDAVEVMILLPSVASPEFDQAGGASRSVKFRAIQGTEILNKFSFLSSEVEIEFRTRVRYRGHSWLVKGESDMRAKCKRVKAIKLGQGIKGISKIENPNCRVDGFWQTARIVMLSSTLVLPFLVLVFLSFSSCWSTSPRD